MLLKASDFVNTLMKLELHKMRDISRLAAWLLASQEGLCSIDLAQYKKKIYDELTLRNSFFSLEIEERVSLSLIC
jgi:hypothetical protein